MDDYDLSYTLAHATICAVFDWREEVHAFMRHTWEFIPEKDDTPTFHIVGFGSIHSTPQTMCVEFLKQFKLQELKSLLLLYRAATPDSWSPTSSESCRSIWYKRAVAGIPIPCLKFGKSSLFKVTLTHINEQIAHQAEIARDRARQAWNR